MIFLIVGVVNTFFGFFVLFLLSFTHLDTWLILLLSQLFGLVFNFFTTGHYVFRTTSWKFLSKFILVSIFIYFVYLLSINLFIPYVENRTIAILILVTPISLLNYFIFSRYVFINVK